TCIELRCGFQSLEEERGELAQCVHWAVTLDSALEQIATAFPVEIETCADDRVFAIEVVINRTRAEASLFVDLAHGGLMEPLARKAPISGLDDLRSPGCAVFFTDFRHGGPGTSVIKIDRSIYITARSSACQDGFWGRLPHEALCSDWF